VSRFALRGSIVPLPTPFSAGAIHWDAFLRLAERALAGGSHGIAVGGSTGEPWSLSLAERQELIRQAVAAAGKAPVLAGTGCWTLEETVALTRKAQELGATAALVWIPPGSKANPSGLYSYFSRLAEAVGGFPLLLYNVPGRTGAAFSPELVQRLAESHANIVGIKHSSEDLGALSRFVAIRDGEFAVFCGLEALTLPMMTLGAVGTVAATANWLPREVAELCEVALQGNWERARSLHFALREANEAIFWDTNPVPLKTVLGWMGVCQAEWRPPLGPTTPEIAARLATMARRYGLLDHEKSALLG